MARRSSVFKKGERRLRPGSTGDANHRAHRNGVRVAQFAAIGPENPIPRLAVAIGGLGDVAQRVALLHGVGRARGDLRSLAIAPLAAGAAGWPRAWRRRAALRADPMKRRG